MMTDSDRQKQCDVHGEMMACVNFMKKGGEDRKTEIKLLDARLDGMVTMRVFTILISILALCLGGIFGITLNTNNKISDIGTDLRGMSKDIAINSRDIMNNTGDLRAILRKYRMEPNGDKK